MVSGAEKHDRWVQCDKCDKWRRLPGCTDTEYAALMANPRWQCNKNRWDQARASCTAPEEEGDTCDSSLDGLPSSQLLTPANEAACPVDPPTIPHSARGPRLGDAASAALASPGLFLEEKSLAASVPAVSGWGRRGGSAPAMRGGVRGGKSSRGGRRQNSLNSDGFVAVSYPVEEAEDGLAGLTPGHVSSHAPFRGQDADFAPFESEEDVFGRDASPSRCSQAASLFEGHAGTSGKRRFNVAAAQRGKKRKCDETPDGGAGAETPAEANAVPYEETGLPVLATAGNAGRAASLIPSALQPKGQASGLGGGSAGQPFSASGPSTCSPSLSASLSNPASASGAREPRLGSPERMAPTSPPFPSLEALASGGPSSRMEETAHALVQSLAAGGLIDRENLSHLLASLSQKPNGSLAWARGIDLSSSLLSSALASHLRNAAPPAVGDANDNKTGDASKQGDGPARGVTDPLATPSLPNSASLLLGSLARGENWLSRQVPGAGVRASQPPSVGRGLNLAKAPETPAGANTQRAPQFPVSRQTPVPEGEGSLETHHATQATDGKGVAEATSAAVDNWVQCEACKKWRRLPASVDPDRLPDTWLCAMTFWDPLHDSCEAPEEDYRDTVATHPAELSTASPGVAVAALANRRASVLGEDATLSRASLSEEALAKLLQGMSKASPGQLDLASIKSALGGRAAGGEGRSLSPPLKAQERDGFDERKAGAFDRLSGGSGVSSSPKKQDLASSLAHTHNTAAGAFGGVGQGGAGVSPFAGDRLQEPASLCDKLPAHQTPGGRGRRAKGELRGRKEDEDGRREEDGDGTRSRDRDDVWDPKALGGACSGRRQGLGHDLGAFSSAWMAPGAAAASPFAQLGGAHSDTLADGAAVTVLRIPPAARESGHPLADRLMLYAADGTVASCLACELPFQTLQLRLLEAYRYETPSRGDAALDFSFVSGFSPTPTTSTTGRKHREASSDLSSFSRENSLTGSSREGKGAKASPPSSAHAPGRASSLSADGNLFPFSCLQLLSQLGEAPRPDGRDDRDGFSLDFLDRKGACEALGKSAFAAPETGDRAGSLDGDEAYFSFLEKNVNSAFSKNASSLASSNEICVSLDFAANVRWPGLETLSSDSEEEDARGGREGGRGREREEEGKSRRVAVERRESANRADDRRLRCMLNSVRELVTLCPLLEKQVGALPSRIAKSGEAQATREGFEVRRERESGKPGRQRDDEPKTERREGRAGRRDDEKRDEDERREVGRGRPFAVLELKDIIGLVCMAPDACEGEEEDEDAGRRERDRKKRKKGGNEEKEEKEKEEEKGEEEKEEREEEKEEREEEKEEREEEKEEREEEKEEREEEKEKEEIEDEEVDEDRRKDWRRERMEVEEEREKADGAGEDRGPKQGGEENRREETSEREGGALSLRSGDGGEEEGKETEGLREETASREAADAEAVLHEQGKEEKREGVKETDNRDASFGQGEEGKLERPKKGDGRARETESVEREPENGRGEAEEETENGSDEAEETENGRDEAEVETGNGRDDAEMETVNGRDEAEVETGNGRDDAEMETVNGRDEAEMETEKAGAVREEHTTKGGEEGDAQKHRKAEGEQGEVAAEGGEKGEEAEGESTREEDKSCNEAAMKTEEEKEGAEQRSEQGEGHEEETGEAKVTVPPDPQKGDSLRVQDRDEKEDERPNEEDCRSCPDGEREGKRGTEKETEAHPRSQSAQKRKRSVVSTSSEDEKEGGKARAGKRDTQERQCGLVEKNALLTRASLRDTSPVAPADSPPEGAKIPEKDRQRDEKEKKPTVPEMPLSPSVSDKRQTKTPASENEDSGSSLSSLGSSTQQNPSRTPPSLSANSSSSPFSPSSSSSSSSESRPASLNSSMAAFPSRGPLPASGGLEFPSLKSDPQGVSGSTERRDRAPSLSEAGDAGADVRRSLPNSRVEKEEGPRGRDEGREEAADLGGASAKALLEAPRERNTPPSAFSEGGKPPASSSLGISPEERRFSRHTTSARGSSSQSSASVFSTSPMSSSVPSSRSSSPSTTAKRTSQQERERTTNAASAALSKSGLGDSSCENKSSAVSSQGAAFLSSGEGPSESCDESPAGKFQGGDSAASGAVSGGREAGEEPAGKTEKDEPCEKADTSRDRTVWRVHGDEPRGGGKKRQERKEDEQRGVPRPSSPVETLSGDQSRTSSRQGSPTRKGWALQRERRGDTRRAEDRERQGDRSRSPSEPGLPPPSPMSSPPSPGPRDSGGLAESPRSLPSSPSSSLPPAYPAALPPLPPGRTAPFRPSPYFSPASSPHSSPPPPLHRPGPSREERGGEASFSFGSAPPSSQGDGLLGPGRPGTRPSFDRLRREKWRHPPSFSGPRRGVAPAPEPESDDFSSSSLKNAARGFSGGDRDAERNGDRRDPGPGPRGSGVVGSRRGAGASTVSSGAPVTVLSPPAPGEPHARPMRPRILNLPSRISSGPNLVRGSSFFSRPGRGGEPSHFEEEFLGTGGPSGSPSSSGEGRALLGPGPPAGTAKARGGPLFGGPEKRDRRPGYEGDRGDPQWGETHKGSDHASSRHAFSSTGRPVWGGGPFPYAGAEDAGVSSSGPSLPFGSGAGDFPARPAAPPVLLPPPTSSFFDSSKAGFSAYASATPSSFSFPSRALGDGGNGVGGAQLAGDSGDSSALLPLPPRRGEGWGDEERERRRGGGGSGSDSFFYQNEDSVSFRRSTSRETLDMHGGGEGAVLRRGEGATLRPGGGAWHGGERRSSGELGGAGYRASHRRRDD
ncbi:cw-type zinc finger domain-containing protein,related [Neospora caninum Liverpool]|uniref:CW-type Zinc finger domain-containing protein,related n=1 Tax=Neospora caninum (strain Liverpool) TaxID=572307 RepID=F0V8G0_NEOCL|nr:cw-type zinc finger domain-containing protein,related [Neospora caninum Liverpool]CBZ50001.1 cw-type zinc finger domain-containing protein,related [Neospora caninum Liverpool]CEL64591.1 TPA: CW-type zinc finger domain-containing protein,related [Neospora caninum Liverpool]|eukprot:XP_003880036.1 cw-type zinc finger domain-containing protein,related [Neospora caninum Liverpool]